MAYSDNINTALAGLQNQNPDYFSQLKGMLLEIATALVVIDGGPSGPALKQFANGSSLENISMWVDLKPQLVAVQVILADAGATVTTLDSLLQPIPTGDGKVYSDQLKPVMSEIASLLAFFGQ
tara:strand:- start:1 stop:369 length:369 start_codon:yes stop_codon:yes gene_type:complete